MSVCIFIAADCPLPKIRPPKEYPVHINVDCGTIDDGGADDNYFLLPFDDVGTYSEKKYGVCLEWTQYTEGRARQIIDYIKNAVQKSNSVELWNVWLMDYWEYDERPYIHKETVAIDKLTVNEIKKINDVENWNNKDTNRPSFYCIEIIK